LVLRLMGLRRLPDVSTIWRALCQMEAEGVEKVRELSTAMVIEGLKRESLYRLTFDFDGVGSIHQGPCGGDGRGVQ
jgi:hypothetical protein